MSSFNRLIASALVRLGYHGTRVLAVMVFVGIAASPVGTLLKPLVPEVIFLLLYVAILRVDPNRLRQHLARPTIVIAAAAWTMLLLPALLCWSYKIIGAPGWSPDLMLALVLQVAAPPIMSSPAIAALLGLDSALVLIAMVASTALIPLTTPVFVHVFASKTPHLSELLLGLKLAGYLGAAGLLAMLTRWIVGSDRITAQGERIDGLNVVVMSIFIVALMNDVAGRLFSEPVLVLALTGLAFLLTLISAGLTALIFIRTGRYQAYALGLLASQRNMGLMLAALGSTLPNLVWLYFALAQLPIFLMPQMVRPLVPRSNPDTIISTK